MHEISGKRIDSRSLGASVSLVLIVRLLAHAVVKHRESATISHLAAVDHDSLCAQTSLHFQLLVLSLHCVDHITTKKHLHFSEAILEKLRLLDFHLVSEEINL